MKPIGPDECGFPELLLQMPLYVGQRGKRQEEERRSLIATIRSNQTVRYLIDGNIALGMIRNTTPLPAGISTSITFPDQGTTYIEYDGAIKLEPSYRGDECPDFFNGLLILPEESTAAITTLGTTGIDILTLHHFLDLTNGTVTNPSAKKISREQREEDNRQARRYFIRLAAYMRAFSPNTQPHPQTT